MAQDKGTHVHSILPWHQLGQEAEEAPPGRIWAPEEAKTGREGPEQLQGKPRVGPPFAWLGGNVDRKNPSFPGRRGRETGHRARSPG